MNCTQVQEKMMDVLYGELLDSRTCFEFFRHLQECRSCDQEYLELVGTRELLSEWELPEANAEVAAWRPRGPQRPVRPANGSRLARWGGIALKSAAALLIVIGGLSLVREAGLLGVGERIVQLPESRFLEYTSEVVENKLQDERVRLDRIFLRVYEELQAEQKQQLASQFEELQLYFRSISDEGLKEGPGRSVQGP